MQLHRGQCSCGSVAFNFANNNLYAYQCHCSICRKATGSVFSTTIVVSDVRFEWTRGKEKVTTYTKESGYKVSFCSQCGSPVPNQFRGLPLYTVPAGSLEDSDHLEIVAHIHLSSKATWDPQPSTGHQYDEIPACRLYWSFWSTRSLSAWNTCPKINPSGAGACFELEWYPVSEAVNNMRNELPELANPI